MQMAFSFLLSPPSPSLPNPAAAAASASTSYLVAAHHGCRRRRPPEPRCRCGRSPEIASTSSSSSSGDRGSCEEEEASSTAGIRPLELDGAVSSADSQTGSEAPATLTEGDTRNGEFGRWQKNQSSTDGSFNSMSKSVYSKAFGVDLSPDNVAVATVYFVQGVLGLSRLAVSFYLKDDLQLDPAETAVITGFSALPWLVKPLYGFISDSVPLFGYRRRSYLILSGILGAISWSFMATIVDDKYSAALYYFWISCSRLL